VRRLALVLALTACGGADEPFSARDITLSSLHPSVLLPGSRVVVTGGSFIPSFAGPSRLQLRGTLEGEKIALALPLEFVDYDRMELTWPGGAQAGLPFATGAFSGTAAIAGESSLDGLAHESGPLELQLRIASELSPQLDSLQNEVLFVNDPVVARGAGFLLGGNEGTTAAVVSGCYTPSGEKNCTPVGPAEVAAAPLTPFDRTRAVFPFSPVIAGIRPGSFKGNVKLVNRHGKAAGSVSRESGLLMTANDILPPTVTSFSPSAASLGQYVEIAGGGFVAQTMGQSSTTIVFEGSFAADGKPAVNASVSMVPEFASGQLARYAVNEDDQLGKAIDLRKVTGSFTGTARPVVKYGSDEVKGSATKVSLSLLPVKQVVWIRFLPTYVESLRHFGLRAADSAVRARVLAVVKRDYLGVNLDLREKVPTDFALFARVDVGGPDPNDLGLLGYDNSPGKDNGNLRLYDVIGGVNALTQQDGSPGYGGVFVDSLFAFSTHPNGLAKPVAAPDAVFDSLFDPFRPDTGGDPVHVDELAALPAVTSAQCPAEDRRIRIACAIHALGSLIGTTVSHEVAHALGLADPGGPAFHNSGDWPNEIMDGGDARPFRERAEVMGQGPGIFCARNYSYLRSILPTKVPDPIANRGDCY
jgi:hypothetical protein